jgi:quercetin dioxygenase-like cupin family protein
VGYHAGGLRSGPAGVDTPFEEAFMRFADYAAIAPREVSPGFHGRYVHSDHVTQGRVDIDAGAQLPEHSHLHEQWTTVQSGTLELTVDGTVLVLRPGQLVYIPPHVRHSARAVTACQVLDVFHPVREDYR